MFSVITRIRHSMCLCVFMWSENEHTFSFQTECLSKSGSHQFSSSSLLLFRRTTFVFVHSIASGFRLVVCHLKRFLLTLFDAWCYFQVDCWSTVCSLLVFAFLSMNWVYFYWFFGWYRVHIMALIDCLVPIIISPVIHSVVFFFFLFCWLVESSFGSAVRIATLCGYPGSLCLASNCPFVGFGFQLLPLCALVFFCYLIVVGFLSFHPTILQIMAVLNSLSISSLVIRVCAPVTLWYHSAHLTNQVRIPFLFFIFVFFVSCGHSLLDFIRLFDGGFFCLFFLTDCRSFTGGHSSSPPPPFWAKIRFAKHPFPNHSTDVWCCSLTSVRPPFFFASL